MRVALSIEKNLWISLAFQMRATFANNAMSYAFIIQNKHTYPVQRAFVAIRYIRTGSKGLWKAHFDMFSFSTSD